ncbi:homoserine kinase [uncultured Phascolarctobacterium sp.]|uniref:homoserine kinase n=1 Tax=uncultured Phascolarctobacterium sp. TaxID=512296 RepID=UPI0025EF96B9|nr:homoserine kinase [uncultured Phascolarctobacterium sp.]
MMKKVTIQVPATSANCGPGFDTLGLACTLYNEVTYEITDTKGFQLCVTGEGADYLKPFGRNLAFASFLRVWNKAAGGQRIGLKVTMHNRIPMSRGLGSSSSAIVAGLYAANCLCGNYYNKDELLGIATDIEGHPDNVAPAIYGGFTISYMDNGKAHSLRLQPAKPLKFIAVVPDSKLPTVQARQAIPANIAHKDAVFNTSRASLLVGALLSGNYQYLGAALEDKLHQPYRAHLIPGLREVFAAAKEAGAYNAIISGAGSTVMAYAAPEADCQAIAEAMKCAFAAQGEHCAYHILDLDTDGVKAI